MRHTDLYIFGIYRETAAFEDSILRHCCVYKDIKTTDENNINYISTSAEEW